VRLPELVQGLVLTLGSIIYLGLLSPALLGVTALWVTVTMVVGWLLVNRVYRHLAHMRQAEDQALPELPVHHRREQGAGAQPRACPLRLPPAL
jgi:ABC-type siderophore export system fused ATPase/permease subunit